MTVVDAHLHFLDPGTVEYPWLTPGRPLFGREFTGRDVEPELRQCGVASAVLVQAAYSGEETRYLLAQTDAYPWIAGVVGWVPLTEPAEAARALNNLAQHRRFVGVRHSLDDYDDGRSLLRSPIIDGLRVLADAGKTFDVLAVHTCHLSLVPVIAAEIPELKIVIDHLAKPPMMEGHREPWLSLLSRAADHGNVYAKVSGLATGADGRTCRPADFQPYVLAALDLFGASRLMFGSDWPICTQAGGYRQTWSDLLEVTSSLSVDERESLSGRTAESFYDLHV